MCIALVCEICGFNSGCLNGNCDNLTLEVYNAYNIARKQEQCPECGSKETYEYEY